MSIPSKSDPNSGYVGAQVVQPGAGIALAQCPADMELCFAVTLSVDVAADEGESVTFGCCDYDQQPTAFPAPNNGFHTINGVDIKVGTPGTPSNSVVSFNGQIPIGSRFGVRNDTNNPISLSIRWSPRKVLA